MPSHLVVYKARLRGRKSILKAFLSYSIHAKDETEIYVECVKAGGFKEQCRGQSKMRVLISSRYGHYTTWLVESNCRLELLVLEMMCIPSNVCVAHRPYLGRKLERNHDDD